MSKFTDRIDMRFLYVPAASTDIRKTLNRVRRQIAKAEAAKQAEAEAAETEVRAKVCARRIK